MLLLLLLLRRALVLVFFLLLLVLFAAIYTFMLCIRSAYGGRHYQHRQWSAEKVRGGERRKKTREGSVKATLGTAASTTSTTTTTEA